MNANFKKYMLALAEKGLRADGRGLLDRRQPVIEYNISNNAEGSAKVTMGNTVVNCGVKMEVGTPYPDKPDEGSLVVSAELGPISSKKFEPGPPTENAIELARVVDRGIRESHAIDTKKLCIESGKKIWIALIDLYIQNHDGNLIDACSLAALAALRVAKFPKYDEVTQKADYHEHTETAVPMQHMPICITVSKIGNYLIVDPTSEEEDEIETKFTIIVNENDKINGVQKSGEAGLTLEEIKSAVDIALEQSKGIRSLL